MTTKKYRSSVYFLFWKMPVEEFTITVNVFNEENLDCCALQEIRPEKYFSYKILKSVRAIWRPFLRVEWEEL